MHVPAGEVRATRAEGRGRLRNVGEELGDDVGLDLGGALPHEDWQAEDPEVPAVRRIDKPGGIFDDCHEDWEAGAPKVTTVTKIGNALAMASTGSSSRRTVEEEDGAAEGAAVGAGRLVGALVGAADGADEDDEGAVAADARGAPFPF